MEGCLLVFTKFYIHGQLLNLGNRINILGRVYPLSFADWVFRIESWWCGRVFVLGECLWQIGAITKDGCHGDDWDQERPPTPRGLAKENAQRRLRKCHSSSVISGPGQTNPLSIIIPSAVTSQNKLTLLMFSVTFVTLLLRGDSRGLMAIRPVLFVS